MALSRIQFSDNASGTSPYTVPINPILLELNDNDNPTLVSIIDGGMIIQNKQYDDRPVTMTWNAIPSDFSGFSTMLTTLRGYINSIRYLNFADVDYRVTTSVWNKFRVANLDVKVRRGGPLRYDVTLILIPEQ